MQPGAKKQKRKKILISHNHGLLGDYRSFHRQNGRL